TLCPYTTLFRSNTCGTTQPPLSICIARPKTVEMCAAKWWRAAGAASNGGRAALGGIPAAALRSPDGVVRHDNGGDAPRLEGFCHYRCHYSPLPPITIPYKTTSWVATYSAP